MREVPFETLLGKTLSTVIVGEDEIKFITDNNQSYIMNHYQDCCERVVVESVTGDVEDLIGSPITLAEEASNHYGSSEQAKVMYALMPTDPMPFADESWSWTFYKLATIKGYVDIRWFGTSSGYYSEAVSFSIDDSSDE